MRQILVILLILLFIVGCAKQDIPPQNNPPQKNEPASNADLSCAYFYFLWGNHAEYSQRFNEALEAYQKALICDPKATHIQQKIPLLLLKLGKKKKATAWLERAIAEHPEDTGQQLLLAQLNAQEKNWDKARTLYQQVLDKEPDNERALLFLGNLYAQQHQYPAAEKIFRILVKNHSEIYLGHVYLARLLLITERFAEAAQKYQDALELNWSAALIFEMTTAYARQGDFATVLSLYKEILDKENNNEQAILSLVATLQKLDRNQEALQKLQHFYNTESSPRVNMALSKLLLQNEQRDKAKQILRQLSKTPLASEANYLRSLVAYQEKEFSKALKYLSKITSEAQEYPEAIYLQVRILRKLNDSSQAQRLLQEAIAEPSSQHPLFYALLASLYQEEDQKDKAQKILEQGQNTFPKNILLLHEYAQFLERNNRHLDAFTIMQQVLELNNDDAEALNFIGYSWADRNINLEKAHQYILRAIELEPKRGYIRDSLGWVLFRLGKIKEAQHELLQAITMESGDPHIYEHLGDVHATLKLFEKAKEFYLQGLKISRSPEYTQRIQRKIDEIIIP